MPSKLGEVLNLIFLTNQNNRIANASFVFRFENTSNKKTLKRAWRFFLLKYLFVTTAGFKPATS